jgi:cytoskeleton protein RodZ
MSDLNDDFVVSSNSPTLGARLQQARENKKLSLAEVATQLRLTKDIVMHLEAQQWDKLHGRTYARGYFASYVKFLGLPQEEMLAVFNDEYKQVETEPRLVKPVGTEEPKSLPWLMIVFFLVGIFILWSAYQQWQSNRADDETAINESSETLSEQNDLDEVSNTTFNDDSSQLEPEAEDSSPSTINGLNTIAQPSEQDYSDNRTESDDFATIDENEGVESVTGSELDQNILKMSFSGDCWVEVTDSANTVLLSQVMRAEQSIELKSELPMKILLGKASVAEVNYNNQPVDLQPFTQGNVAKLTLGAQS